MKLKVLLPTEVLLEEEVVKVLVEAAPRPFLPAAPTHRLGEPPCARAAFLRES